MANISGWRNAVANAEEGALVRGYIAEILRKVNTDGPNAEKLNGKTAKEYVTKDSLTAKMLKIENLVQKDTMPNKNSENLLMTRGIRQIIGPLNNEWPATS